MFKGFFAEAKTVEFVQLRVKLFCPKIDPLFGDFCRWGGGERGGGGGWGGKRCALIPSFRKKKVCQDISMGTVCRFYLAKYLKVPGNARLSGFARLHPNILGVSKVECLENKILVT